MQTFIAACKKYDIEIPTSTVRQSVQIIGYLEAIVLLTNLRDEASKTELALIDQAIHEARQWLDEVSREVREEQSFNIK
jgi:hypothetical protein